MKLVRFLLLFQIFFVITLCDNSDVFTLNTIAKQGVNFMDVVKEFQLNDAITITVPCANQINYLAANNTGALVQMADAWSRFPYSGYLYGSRNDYGNYDECISVKVQSSDEEAILGKFCALGLIIPDISAETQDEMITNAWKLSYCVPHLCTAADLNSITNSIMNQSLFNEIVCSTQETDSELDFGAIVTIAIFGVIGFLMVLSTIYDLWYYKPNEKGSFILTSFSVYSNGKRLLAFSRHSREQILCFHGIKFISMWWIIAGHNAVAWQSYPIMNMQWGMTWQNLAYSQYILSAHLSVDSFFFISGFLLAYLYFKNELSRKPFGTQLKAIPFMILHRYLRLTPAILMTFLFGVYLLKYIGDGPIFAYEWDGPLLDPCKENWWAVFLYVQNYYIFSLGTELCFTTLWYVCADMQLFLVAPLIILPIAALHKRSFKVTMAALLAINILFIGVPIFTKMMFKDYDPDLSEYDFQSRLTDYFIGVMMGICLRNKTIRDFKIEKVTNLFTWFLVLAGMFGVVIATHQVNVHCDYNGKVLWLSFSRPLWCIGLSWITFACFTGHGGFIDWILSNRFMQLGGKLTYCIYLVHGLIILHYTILVRHRRNFSDYNMFFDWAGYFVMSMVIATIWALAFELPMLTIEKLLFGRPVAKTPAKNESKQTK